MTMYNNLFEHPAYMMSFLSDRPTVGFLVDHREYVVFWGGVIMPYTSALYIALRPSNIFPTPSVKQKLDDSFRRLYGTGALKKGPKSPVDPLEMRSVTIPDTLDSYLRLMRNRWPKIVEKFKVDEENGFVRELFKMLDTENALEIQLVTCC